MAQTPYEREREERIARNRCIMEDMGLSQAVADLAPSLSQPTPRAPRPPRLPVAEEDKRRSARGVPRKNYDETAVWVGLDSGRAGSGRRVFNDEEMATLRGAARRESRGDGASRGAQDSGRGIRIQGGRVYDSAFGTTCHWCRQKTLEKQVQCSRPDCGNGRRLPTSFCGMCLRNRHGEDVVAAAAAGNWVCPPCRVSCGPGCVSCCNCGPCRKKAGLGPTHQLIKMAREAGCSNVHDYLVLQSRGSDLGEIMGRKATFDWGAFLTSEPAAEPEAAEGDEGAPAAGAGQAPEEAAPVAAALAPVHRRSVTAAHGGGTQASGVHPTAVKAPMRRRRPPSAAAGAADDGAPQPSAAAEAPKRGRRSAAATSPAAPAAVPAPQVADKAQPRRKSSQGSGAKPQAATAAVAEQKLPARAKQRVAAQVSGRAVGESLGRANPLEVSLPGVAPPRRSSRATV